MKIRRYNKKDKREVKRIVTKVLTEIFKVKPKRGLEDLNNIKKNYSIFFVVEDNGKIIATAGVNKEGVAKRLYIDKKYRGRGLGSKLYDLQEGYIRKKGYTKVKLSTTPQMKDAIKLYKKKGFKRIKFDKEKNQIFFEKKL